MKQKKATEQKPVFKTGIAGKKPQQKGKDKTPSKGSSEHEEYMKRLILLAHVRAQKQKTLEELGKTLAWMLTET